MPRGNPRKTKPQKKATKQRLKAKAQKVGPPGRKTSKLAVPGRSQLLTPAIAQPGCLPYPQAETLVYNCGSPEADGMSSSTPLGNLFRGGRLASFCQCVKNGVPAPPPTVPCSTGSTLQNVIDAITCK